MPDVSKIWCIVLVNADTNEVRSYSDYDKDLPSIKEGLDEANKANILFGHNLIGYDLVVLKHLLNWKPATSVRVLDTWLMSQTNRYKRKHKQGLAGWGEFLGFSKLDFSTFESYSKEMLTYCIRDVELNVKVYHQLVKEATSILKKNPLYKVGLQTEMDFAAIEADIRSKGWLFDTKEANALLNKIVKRIVEIETIMEPRIGMRCIKTDGEDETKTPTWRKDGCYTVATVKHFGFTQESGRSERPIEGAYCRISFEQGKLSSDVVIKDYLYSIGWEPDEWNVERINGKFVNKSPKLTEASLKPLGDNGVLIDEYNTLKNRRGVLTGWIEGATKDGRLRGRLWTIGTPTFRCRHEVIANLPKVTSAYGKEIRGLLKCEPGYVVVGADSSGNQMRGLCHYLENDEFTNDIVSGVDIHKRNADTLGCSRDTAKSFLYAFLFGGGAGKLGSVLTGKRDAKIGQAAIDKFQDSIPGMKELKNKLAYQYHTTRDMFGEDNAFIRAIDGRVIFVSSEHQLLNYLLQTLEGITCKASMVCLKKMLREGEIHDYYFTLFYHDEIALVCREEDADRVASLAEKAFEEGPKLFGVNCMSGNAQIGRDYSQVH